MKTWPVSKTQFSLVTKWYRFKSGTGKSECNEWIRFNIYSTQYGVGLKVFEGMGVSTEEPKWFSGGPRPRYYRKLRGAKVKITELLRSRASKGDIAEIMQEIDDKYYKLTNIES